MPIQPAFGSKDLNPQEVEENKAITSKLSEVYKLWGYEEVSPPNVERLETLIAGGGIDNKDIVKLVADEPIGLRPEMTASIARASLTRFANKQRPLRLWATGTVFKSKEDCDGKFIVEENINSGIELIGMPSMTAEVELLFILIKSLNILNLNDNEKTTLLIGHKLLLKLILNELIDTDQTRMQKLLINYDLLKINRFLRDKPYKDLLLKVLKIRGKPTSVLEQIKSIYGENQLFEELNRLFAIIEPFAKLNKIDLQLDPTYQSQYDLYTGLFFQLIYKDQYSPRVIARGGRYDDLVNIFGKEGKHETGAGFSFAIDQIREIGTKNKGDKGSLTKVLIAFSENKKYEDALHEQLRLHNKGEIAMVELEPCNSKITAEEIRERRGFDKLLWLT